MGIKNEIVNAFIQYGFLPRNSSGKLDALIKRGMKKLNANLLLTNIPESGHCLNVGYINITPEVVYDTLQEFGSPIEVLHHCKNVYVALVKDPESCAEQLSGNKIGNNTINAFAYPSVDFSTLPHKRLNTYFPKELYQEQPTNNEILNFILFIFIIIMCIYILFCIYFFK